MLLWREEFFLCMLLLTCVLRPEATLCGDTVNTAAAHFGVHRGARPLVAVWMSSHLKERLLFA